ncbi:penicillin acylase family protein [Edaphobacillus lindanitolerans]|uniref:Penicillin amidase n=1 Tax=Edaphobacillus lindanitolerans TaxID=550447 RepID=A0A1U7PP87_9BACI|nr:penicillin acylase family protein [Edaphobacillus lindanitolerans]SIT89347.1 penicillin amidase [Edaphobacillus lindanitolerans]
MKKWPKWLKAVAIVLGSAALLAIAVLIFVNAYISKSKPVTEGKLSVPVLEEEVSVVRDAKGVPHIRAASDADLYRAQGFVQAQDRLFQMDLARRQASGRLAEVVGEAAVPSDKLFRTFSLRQAAADSESGYGEDAREVLGWFAEGVNAFIDHAKEDGKLPYEFRLLGYEPEEWTPVDSLTIGKFMAYDLGGNWNALAFRHWAVNEYDGGKMKELFIRYPENAPSILEANRENPVAIAGAFDASLIPPEHNGSNNWVVSGDKTASGKPLLADDPHLGLTTPSIWYEMHLQSPEQNVTGVIFGGIPGIILGHNENVAWGVTNVGPDVQDLYIEEQNPDNPAEFRWDGEWEQAAVRDEPIKVKDGDTIDFEVVTTRHGPIISDIMLPDTGTGGDLLSMQWTALEPTRELEAVMQMNKASDWDDFDRALRNFNAPAQNFVFASKDGTIAYRANGNIPIRKKGDGQLPVPGNSSEYGWEGYIPYEELPTAVNPDEGFIATANNQVIGDDYPYHITDFWAQPYRYERIAEVLEDGDSFTPEDMMDLQMDVKNLYAREFLDEMLGSLKSTGADGKYGKAVKLLEEWNGEDDKELGAPLIFHKWMRDLPRVMFEKAMPEDVYDLMPGKNHITDEMMRQAYAGKPGEWVTEYGGVDKWVSDSFERTMKGLSDEFGESTDKWKWGDYHQLVFPHPLGSASPIFEKLLSPPRTATSGSAVTVQAAGFKDDGSADHGASWRFVADLSDLTRSWHIVGPGQSGHMKSKWFHDQAEDWVAGDYHETRADGTAGGDELKLVPEGEK